MAIVGMLLVALTTGCLGGGSLGGTISGWSPATANNGLVYVATKRGEIIALEDNGFQGASLLWATDLPIPGRHRGTHNSLVFAGDMLYLTSADGHLFALGKEQLQLGERGRVPVGQGQETQPVIAGPTLWDAPGQQQDLVLVGSEDGNLYAYDANALSPGAEPTHPLVWSFATGDKIWSTPVIRDGVAYFGSHDENVYAVYLDAERDKREKWRFPTGGIVAGRPLLFRDTIIVGSFDKRLYALDVGDGSLRWTFEGGNWFWAAAVADESTIYAPSMDGNLYALNANGKLLWKHSMGSAILSSPVVLSRGLVVAGKNGKISLLDTGPVATAQGREVAFFSLRDTEIKSSLSKWVTPNATTDDQWRRLLQEMGGEQLVNDPRFADATARQQNQQQLDEQIAQWVGTQGPDKIGRQLHGAGVPLVESVYLGAQDSTVWRFDVKYPQLIRMWCYHTEEDGLCQ